MFLPIILDINCVCLPDAIKVVLPDFKERFTPAIRNNTKYTVKLEFLCVKFSGFFKEMFF
jgi:hypothetical protein